MPALAPVLLVAVISFAAFATDSLLPPPTNPTSLLAQAGRTGDIDLKSYTPPIGGDIKIDIDPNYANLQCPKEEKLLRYRSNLPYNAKFTINKVTYTNMYGKPCEGKAIQAFCSGPQKCDGNMKGSRCLINNKWEDHCELPEQKVKVASLQSNTNPNVVCEGCTTGGGAPKSGGADKALGKSEVPAPAAPKETTRGIDTVYRPAQGPVERGTIPNEFSSQARLNELAQGQPAAPVPKSGTVDKGLGNVRLNQEVSRGIQGPVPVQPGQVQPGGLPTGIKTGPNPLRPTLAESTFPKSPITTPKSPLSSSPLNQATSRTGGVRSAFTNIFSGGFSARGVFSGITNLMEAVVGSTRQKSAQTQVTTQVAPQVPRPVVQQTLVIAPQKPTTTPTTPTAVILPSLTQGQQDVSSLYAGLSTQYEQSGAPSRGSRELGTLVDIGGPTEEVGNIEGGDTDIVLPSTDIFIPGAETLASPQQTPAHADVPAPAIFRADASSTPEVARHEFLEKIAAIATSTKANGDFRPASTTQRTTSLVQIFHAISIPDLLDAITQGSMDLINRVLARGTPESSVITTSYNEKPVTVIDAGGAPLLPGTADAPTAGIDTLPSARTPTIQTGSGPRETVVVRDAEEYTELLRDDATWVFRDASPAHQAEKHVTVVSPRIFPDVVPVPQAKEAAQDQPSVISGVVNTVVDSVRNLISRTLPWLSARGSR